MSNETDVHEVLKDSGENVRVDVSALHDEFIYYFQGCTLHFTSFGVAEGFLSN